jgi:hypothetical protein
VRVATYNLLSSHLVPADRFKYCDPKNLEAGVRLERILAKLEAETAAAAVCCLQEVPRGWCGALRDFFEARDFTLVTSLYGAPYSDYMGVAVAFPRARMELLEADVRRVAHTKPWPEPPAARAPAAASAAGVLLHGARGAAGAVGAGVARAARSGRGAALWLWAAALAALARLAPRAPAAPPPRVSAFPALSTRCCWDVAARRDNTSNTPPVLRTDRTRRVPHPVLIGHAASLATY